MIPEGPSRTYISAFNPVIDLQIISSSNVSERSEVVTMAYLIPCPFDDDLVPLIELDTSVPEIEVSFGAIRRSDEKKVEVRSITKKEEMKNGPIG